MTLPWKVGLGLLAVVAASGLFWLRLTAADVKTTIVINATATAEPTP